MKLTKAITMLALVAILAGGAGPAFADRHQETRDDRDQETRDDAQQPEVNDGSDHGSASGDEAIMWRLPKSTRGFSCAPIEKNGVIMGEIMNGTGAVVPKGSQIKIYVDPGQKVFYGYVKEDWLPGTTITGVVSFDDDVELSCSVKVTYELDPPEEPKTSPFEPGDVGKVVPKFTCELVEGGTLITNTGSVPLPTNKMIRWKIPGYKVGWVPDSPIMPGESVLVPGDNSKLRAGAECEPTGVGGIYLP